MIQKPYTFADIPPDLIGSPGQILASDVYSVAGSKKTKRSELALAIDRQGVNIYDVPSAKLTSSYSISPQAAFTCPPCSVRYRGLDIRDIQRHTYCSTISPQPKIFSFLEKRGSGLGTEISTTSFRLKNSSSPIVWLGTDLATDKGSKSNPKFQVLAVREDGEISCYSEDLQRQWWTVNPLPTVQNALHSCHVELAMVTGVEEATKSWLKDRPEILAYLGDHADCGSLLLLLTRFAPPGVTDSESSLRFQIFKIKTVKAGQDDLTTRSDHELKEIESCAIPEPSHFRSESASFKFHTASGTLYQQVNDSVSVYNLNGPLPRLAHRLDRDKKDLSSILRLSSNSLAFSTAESIYVVDLPYGSLQAERTAGGGHGNPNVMQSTKVPEGHSPSHTGIRLLSYFGTLDLAIAMEGRKILAIQMSTSTAQADGSRKRKRPGLLIDSISRGSSSMTLAPSQDALKLMHIAGPLGTSLPSACVNDDWVDQKKKLDKLFAQGNTGKFENILANELEIGNAEVRHFDQRKISYALNKIFLPERPGLADFERDYGGTPGKLTIRYYPSNICIWLCESGLLAIDLIEIALKQHGSLPITQRLAIGALIDALAQYDPSLKTLEFLLESPAPLSSGELVHVLKHTTQHSNAVQPPASIKFIAYDGFQSTEASNDDTSLTNGATKDSQQPSPLSTALNAHHHLLNQTLIRLHPIPKTTITAALKSYLPTPNLRTLIDILRMELARGGWLSLYSTPPSPCPLSSNQSRQTNEDDTTTQITQITHLLSPLLDSIGTAGWLLANNPSDDFNETANTIGYMQAEISAALEGIEEASYLKGMLGEMLLYGKDALAATAEEKGTGGQVVERKGEGSGLLPLGLKMEKGVELTKVGAGGEVMKRSRRDIGRLKSRRVGKYGFERIVV